MKYWEADEVGTIAEDLIHLHHPHLLEEPIRYIFREKAAKKHDKVVRGTASILSGRAAFFALSPKDFESEVARQESPSFFVIEIAHDEWLGMDAHARQALVDHELSHCWACDVEKGKGEDTRTVRSLSLQGHDVEEFAAIIERYGFWKQELEEFNRTCREKSDQLGLFEIQERTAEPQEQELQVVAGGRSRKK